MESRCDCKVLDINFRNGSILADYVLEVQQNTTDEEVQYTFTSSVKDGTFVSDSNITISADYVVINDGRFIIV